MTVDFVSLVIYSTYSFDYYFAKSLILRSVKRANAWILSVFKQIPGGLIMREEH